MKKVFEWSHSGREHLKIELNMNEDTIVSSTISSKGCLAFLKRSQEIKKLLNGPISSLPAIKGGDHSSIIWREMIAQIKDEWKIPVEHGEVCHCRKVNTQTVDRAVVYGAKTVADIRQRTSANTGCGTCMEDVQSLINNRLKNQ